MVTLIGKLQEVFVSNSKTKKKGQQINKEGKWMTPKRKVWKSTGK